jgi:hypothetical protein
MSTQYRAPGKERARDARPRARRLEAAALLAFFTCAVALGALMSGPAAADRRSSARTLRITVNRPGDVYSGARLTMRCRAKDQQGAAIKGVDVTYRWRLPQGTMVDRTKTNAAGLATARRTTTCGSGTDYRARVTVTASWRGQVVQVVRSFTIIGGT